MSAAALDRLLSPSVAADQFHEGTGAVFFANKSARRPCYPDEHLLVGLADRKNEVASRPKLLQQRFRDVGASGGDEYTVVGRVLAPSNRSVKALHGCVVTSYASNVGLRGSRQLSESFDREDATGDA